jgi:hypothetical protein
LLLLLLLLLLIPSLFFDFVEMLCAEICFFLFI